MSSIKLLIPWGVMSEIKSLPLCHAAAEELLSKNCCIATYLCAAQPYLMGLKKDLPGSVEEEKINEMKTRKKLQKKKKKADDQTEP